MKKVRVVRRAAAVVVLSALAAACSHNKPPSAPVKAESAPQPVHEGDGIHERIVPHTCAAKAKMAQLYGQKQSAALASPNEAADSAPPPAPPAGGAGGKAAGNDVYRMVAPATAIIRNEHGFGTGVVIDPKGYVLTNHHVVTEGRKKDFVITVDVTFGDLSPTGRMTKQEKSREAVVVKDDPVRDMAILKVIDPPSNLAAVKLAKSAPQIAEKVMSIGNAGIGFLWAAKSCSVASVGEHQQDTSMLAALDCSKTDPAASATEAKLQKERCELQKKMMTEAMMSTTQGLAVQTDCAITHGDSGGPLVNAAGEMVGLNQSIAADVATASFHVHLDEIREFTAKYPSEGIALLPDPWCDGGSSSTLEDIDLDGVPDTIVSRQMLSLFGGYGKMSLLIDLDQDHFSKQRDPNQAYDTEIAFLRTGDAAYAWYDVDGDSHFDLLLVDKDDDGAPEAAYRIGADGVPKEDKSALPKHLFAAKLVKDASLHPRLAKIADAVGGSKYLSSKLAAAGAKASTMPDPILGGGTEGNVLDTDGDGKPDVAMTRAAFSRALLIDTDQDSIGSMKPGDKSDDVVKSKKIDPEVSIILAGDSVWAMYDLDNDSKFDLALMTNGGIDSTFMPVLEAWHLSPGGERTPAPDQLGRRLLRPTLLPMPHGSGVLRLASSDVSTDEGMGSLPDPLKFEGRYFARDMKGIPTSSVVVAQHGRSSVMLFDVDHDTKVPAKTDINDVVAKGNFDAEVAVLHHGTLHGPGSDWVFYDTDGDNHFDLVLFVAESGGSPVQAYRLVKPSGGKPAPKPAKGKPGEPPPPTQIAVDASAVPGRTFRTKSAFKDKALAAKWKAIATKMFNTSAVED